MEELHPWSCYGNRMIRNTLKMLVVTLVAACALSSIAEAATPTKTRHRTKHSSRVSSGAAATTLGVQPRVEVHATHEVTRNP